MTKKVFGFWTILSLVIGNTIGAGIYLMPSSLAHFGSISLLGWIVSGVGVLFLSFTFARLAKLFSTSGGPYTYAKEGFGRFIGFEVAWSYWISNWVSNAGVIVAIIGYLSFYFPILQSDNFLAFIVGNSILWAFTLINILSLKSSGTLQVFVTAIKVIPIFLVIVFGISHVSFENFMPFTASESSPLQAVAVTAAITMWAFLGFETGTVPAGLVKKPHKIIPRATIWGTLFVVMTYVLVTGVIMGIVPNQELAASTAPFSLAASVIFGKTFSFFVASFAIISSLGTLNGLIIVQGQIPLSAAKDGLFPKLFKKTTKHGEPARALIISSTLISTLLYLRYDESLIDQFTFIILLATLAALIAFLFSSFAEIILCLKNPSSKITGKLIFISCASFLSVFLAIIGAGPKVVFYGALLFFISAPLYIWLSKNKET